MIIMNLFKTNWTSDFVNLLKAYDWTSQQHVHTWKNKKKTNESDKATREEKPNINIQMKMISIQFECKEKKWKRIEMLTKKRKKKFSKKAF